MITTKSERDMMGTWTTTASDGTLECRRSGNDLRSSVDAALAALVTAQEEVRRLDDDVFSARMKGAFARAARANFSEKALEKERIEKDGFK